MKRLLLVAMAFALVACASPPKPATQLPAPQKSAPITHEPQRLVPDGYQGRFRANPAVLENRSHGPQLCWSMQQSNPPQCGGPDITNWAQMTSNWADLQEHVTFQGTTYIDFVTVTGTWDGTRFTLTEKPTTADIGFRSYRPKIDHTTRCAAPAGGWKPVDMSKATPDGFDKAQQLVQSAPDFGGLWIEQNVAPLNESTANDPTKLILNVSFTGDLAEHEKRIREVWGGNLCVSKAPRTYAELEAILADIALPGSIESVMGVIHITTFTATAKYQAELDTKYGAGVVELVGLLQPIDL